MIKTFCVTGHRPQKLPYRFNEKAPLCIKTKEVIKSEIRKTLEDGYNYFGVGMAQGMDIWSTEAALELKPFFPDLFIEACVPCINQDEFWPENAKERYRNLLKQLDLVHYISNERGSKKIMTTRDFCMVNKSIKVISLYGGDKDSGTAITTDYAIKKGREISIIDVNSLDVKNIKGTNSEKVLECSTAGDHNYSAFYAKVNVYGTVGSIEEIYQCSKIINGKRVEDVKKGKGKKPDSFIAGNKEIPVEYLTSWYKLLWCKYLDSRPDLVKYASIYDSFNDTFKGKSVNCQAEVIEQYIRKGRKSIIDECSEFINLIA